MRLGVVCFSLFAFLCIFVQAEEVALKKSLPAVVLQTNYGSFEVTLMPETAPKACENFLALVAKPYYDGVPFHRVIKGFMVQGGDPTGTGTGGQSIWGKPFIDEYKAAVKFDRPGLLAMANRGPQTNGSQFFITTAPTPWLHMHHTIFGEVTTGYEVIQKIESLSTDAHDRPVEEVRILKATIKVEEIH